MVEMLEKSEVGARSLAPKNPLPYWRQVKAVRSYIDGLQALVDAGGPITRLVLGPKWLLPNVVLIASPQGARDLLGRTDEVVDRGRTRTMVEMHALMGGNLLNLPHEQLATAATHAAADVHQAPCAPLRGTHGRGSAIRR